MFCVISKVKFHRTGLVRMCVGGGLEQVGDIRTMVPYVKNNSAEGCMRKNEAVLISPKLQNRGHESKLTIFMLHRIDRRIVAVLWLKMANFWVKSCSKIVSF